MRFSRTVAIASILSCATLAPAQTPYLVIDIDQSSPGAWSSPEMVGVLGDRLFFTARRPDTGRELWTTMGTAASSSLLELSPGPRDIGAGRGQALGDFLLFSAALSADNGGLWISDGSAPGTRRLSPYFMTSEIGVAGTQAFFGSGSLHTSEPWRSDGTTAGTVLLKDIIPGATGSLPSQFVPLGDHVLFYVDNDSPNGLLPAVWRTDGTTEGTRRVTTEWCAYLTRVGWRVFMACGTRGNYALWATDGTPSGTGVVANLPPGFGAPRDLTEVEGALFFSLFSGPGPRLWKSDGTQAGTVQVENGSGQPFADEPRSLTSSLGVLFFAAFTPATGFELWRSDGTDEGTYMLRDIEPGPASSLVHDRNELTAVPGGIVFPATTSATGSELWFSDGTAAGTVPLGEIEPGPGSSHPGEPSVLHTFQLAGSRLFFAATHSATGRELWAVDFPRGVSIGDASVHESDSGATASLAVTLTVPAPSPVSVAFTTVAGTAQQGADFQPVSGQLTFAAGSVGPLMIDVPVTGDLQDEPSETLTVQLTSVGAGTLTVDGRGEILIVDDDGPTVAIGGAVITEGNAGLTPIVFGVTLTTKDGAPTPAPKVIGYATQAGTATADVDFQSAAGTLTFGSGSPSGTTLNLTLAVLGDLVDEPDEVFAVRFEGNSDEHIRDPQVTARIRDDDGVGALGPIEVSSGSAIRATLAPPAGRAADRDYYVVKQQPYSSYEMVIDEASGDAVPLSLERVGANGSTIQAATPVGTGGARSLRWQNTNSTVVTEEHLAVSSAACGTACGGDDLYRLRFYETTLSAARYNNVGGQITVLVLQNRSDAPVIGHVQFWPPTGYEPFERPFAVPARGSLVLDTAAIGVTVGSVTVTHDGPYGSLVGKAVALEPSTGFSFDTPLTYRPR